MRKIRDVLRLRAGGMDGLRVRRTEIKTPERQSAPVFLILSSPLNSAPKLDHSRKTPRPLLPDRAFETQKAPSRIALTNTKAAHTASTLSFIAISTR